MGHNPATRNTQQSTMRTKVSENRSADEIIKTLRGNLKSPLAILKTDVAVLLAAFDASQEAVAHLAGATAGLLTRAEAAEDLVVDLKGKLAEFRQVYEQENRGMAVAFSPDGVTQLEEEISTGTAALLDGRAELEIEPAPIHYDAVFEHGGEA